MEAFTLLKYWRAGSGGCSTGGGMGVRDSGSNVRPITETSTVVTTAGSGEDDDGPFFDLEFTVPEEEENGGGGGGESNETERNDGVESDCTDLTDLSLSLSPSDELFFKGRLMPIEPPGPISKPQFGGALLKSATKFRVFTLGFKKSKQSEADKPEENVSPESLTVKFKVQEVPIMSLFTRDNSSRNYGAGKSKTSDDVMQKYLNKVKPHYVRISRRYSGIGSSVKTAVAPPSTAGQEKDSSEIPVSSLKSQKQGNLPAGLRDVCKHLGKSRSATSTAAPPPPPPAVITSRRDDSLLQQEDGIQSAILHCKRSFQG